MSRAPIPLDRAGRNRSDEDRAAVIRERITGIIAEETGVGRKSAEAAANAVLASLRPDDIPRGTPGGRHTSRLTEFEVQAILARGDRERVMDIAKDYPHVHPATIRGVLRRKTWRDISYTPEWLDTLAYVWATGAWKDAK